MNVWQVVVTVKSAVKDHHGDALKKECAHAGLKSVKGVRVGQAYELSGTLPEAEARRLADRLLTDPVTQEASISAPGAVKDVGIRDLVSARSGRAFEFQGTLAADPLRRFCEEHLMNELIQRVDIL